MTRKQQQKNKKAKQPNGNSSNTIQKGPIKSLIYSLSVKCSE